jgi:hypothetical protein
MKDAVDIDVDVSESAWDTQDFPQNCGTNPSPGTIVDHRFKLKNRLVVPVADRGSSNGLVHPAVKIYPTATIRPTAMNHATVRPHSTAPHRATVLHPGGEMPHTPGLHHTRAKCSATPFFDEGCTTRWDGKMPKPEGTPGGGCQGRSYGMRS